MKQSCPVPRAFRLSVFYTLEGVVARMDAMQQELKKCGISLDVGENEVIVHESTPHFPSAPIEAHNDHRIVMAMAVLLTQTGGVIHNAQVVRKSMPDFFARLEALGITVEHTFTDT